MEQMMSNLGNQKRDTILEQTKIKGIKEGVYDVMDATKLCNKQMQIRKKIIEKINNNEYCSNIMIEGDDSIHSLCFRDMDKEEVAGHIMHRVLVGTGINLGEEREFIFDSIDTEIANLFDKILKASNNEEVDNEIRQFRVEKGQIETIH